MSKKHAEGHKARFWLWEVWLENREVFKLLVGDGLKFILLMLLISIGHYVIALTPLTEERRELLETGHFRVLVTLWGLFSLTLLVEILIVIIRRFRFAKDEIKVESGEFAKEEREIQHE
ncbi:MAG: hypothetical protein ONB46_14875 [candidate division KSB1 bacterium]|nr:hypothetical protein [candidate division KSB1 bacterium]MDZ7367026.1 hypothetical protein [candidate division KSB1 bacterium]MDZ7406726.1 hypothetical protein [candidate division KSB1 bacterium]